jgi:nicotinamide riboside transporter PnuC
LCYNINMIKKYIAWLGTLTSIIGSFCVAFGMMQIGYCLFMIGSASWLTVAIITKDKPLGVLNATFFVANIIGTYRAFV